MEMNSKRVSKRAEHIVRLDDFARIKFFISDFGDEDNAAALAKAFSANQGYAEGVIDASKYIRETIETILEFDNEADVNSVLRSIQAKLTRQVDIMASAMCDADSNDALYKFLSL